ncbi:MAG: response regulator [Thermodesulfobacteriota bacterium]|nr:response regulator [Thermodesulfobacteriota bacterium]
MITVVWMEFHITAMGSPGGLSLHTTNDESYTPGLPGLSYKREGEKFIPGNMTLFTKLKKFKTLLIDDDEWIRDSMSIFFKSEGCTILTLETAEEAISLLEKEKYDILIVDYMLPGMNGIEFFKKISRTGSDPVFKHSNKRPVKILITAHGEKEIASKAKQAGIHDLIQKPFTPESIENSLKKFI